MTKTSLLNATSVRSLAAVSLALTFASPALAQQTSADGSGAATPTAASAQDAVSAQATVAPVAPVRATTPPDSGEIVVTGSRIKRPNLTSAVPITSISAQELTQNGKVSVGDVLNDLPALRSTFSQSNSTRFIGTAGLNLLDLRGLGTQRTLVLVNGRRHVAGDILNTASSVDVNTIPTDLIDRVDVVTGGNSAVYGSDALAGVVNFVLKDHFQGLELRGQGGISNYGDAGSYSVSALGGKNFAGGRGNIALDLEYAQQRAFYASGRPYARRSDGFVTTDTDPAGTKNGSDGIPDRTFYTDIRNGTYSNAGTFLLCCRSGGGFGVAYQPYIFASNGNLVAQTGQILPQFSYTPSYIGGNGDNFRDGQQFAFQPDLKRYSANLIGHFEVSKAFVPFVEATYTRTDSFGSASGPFFTGALGEVFFTDNPYLNAQARSVINQQDSYDASCNYGPDGIPDAQRGQCGVGIYKNAVDLTNRTERARRETYRAVVGVRGDLSDHLRYEVSGNYGRFSEKTLSQGNVNIQRYLLAIDPVDQGQFQNGTPNGNIVCRSKLDPSSASAYSGANAAYANGTLAQDIAQCVPVNLFGSGNITDAARSYLLQDGTAKGRITQSVLSGYVSGDTGGFFNLPGGPIGFSLGAEYRRETAYFVQDAATASGITFGNAIPEFNPPSFVVKEAFGELRLPILKDLPGIRELTVSGAARVADYKGATGTVVAYNAGVEYSPFRSLRFRGNYARAVRAPNLSDLYTPLGQNYDTVSDPCNTANIAQGAATRPANCAADGVPAGYRFEYRSSLGYLSGGNLNLKAERSNSLTLGGVFTPTFVPGFSFSADYYKIKVTNVISSPSAQQVINACYDASSINNQFCALFSRNTSGVTGPAGEVPGQILNNSLNLVPLNYAKLAVAGIDFDLGYDHQLGRLGRLSVHAIYTHALKNNTFLDPTDPGRANRTLGELGDPVDAFNVSTSLKHGRVTLGYKFRYLGHMTPGAYENTHSVQGRDPENADAYPIEYYKAVMYHDARVDIAATKDFNFYVGVDNLLNKRPPYGLTGAGGGSAIYNNIGRFFYSGVVAKFR